MKVKEWKDFYETLDTRDMVEWKKVHIYKFLFPEIAHGNSSLIYLAESEEQKMNVVVKCYKNEWILDHEDIVGNEIKYYGEFGPLGFVPKLLRSPFRTKSNIYFGMEFCNCGSLDKYIMKGKAFPVDIIWEIASFLSNALNKMQRLNVVHRDINPQHILASRDTSGSIFYKLIGLQFCKNPKESNSASDSFVGIPEYAAPEVASGSYSFEADVWSVGLTLYEVALGKLSLKADPDLRKHLRSGLQPRFPSFVSPELKDLICRCLTYDVRRRLTPDEILKHPFLTGSVLGTLQLKPVGPLHFTGTQPTSVPKPHPGEDPELSEIKMADEEDEDELLDVIKRDLTLYIEYVNGKEEGRIKLKSEKRETLDPYVLKKPKPISRGAFGEIYLCADKNTEKEYILKLIRVAKITDIKLANLLLSEIRIMLELNSSPYAIGIVDYFVRKNDLNIIIEYCNGGDLDNYVRRLRRKGLSLPLSQLQLIAWNIALGLNEMHCRKMMHRDIKPKNILVVNSPEEEQLVDVKLCDYGLSKQVAEHKKLDGSTILGTFDYFAPELNEMMEKKLSGEITEMKYDFKIDVWSYGVLLFFALYGKTLTDPPGSKFAVMREHKIIFGNEKSQPQGYIALIKRALTFDPIRRPTFAELLRDPFFYDYVFKPRDSISPYTQEEAIASQGEFRVYRCKKEGRAYAVKAVLPGAGDKGQLLSEVVSLIELKGYEFVAQIHDHFSIKDSAHIVTEYLRGETLESYVRKRKEEKRPLSREEKVFVAYCVVKGLQDVHKLNIIHKNLQPKNIWVELNSSDSVKRAVIGNFGASWTATQTPSKSFALNAYQSPETVLPTGEHHTTSADIWSYGMVLYFLIFGVDPDKYSGNSGFEKVLKSGDVKYDEKGAAPYKEMLMLMGECLKTDPKARPTAFMLLRRPLFVKYPH